MSEPVALREQIAYRIYDAGSRCGECGYTGWGDCAWCEKRAYEYADALLPLWQEQHWQPDGPDLEHDAVEVSRITIVKSFTDAAEGGSAIHTSYSDGLGLADALGMLAFSQAMTVREYMGDDE